MNTLEDIKSAIRKPSRQNLAELHAWFHEFDADAWDRQIEADARSGRLEAFYQSTQRENEGQQVIDRPTSPRTLH